MSVILSCGCRADSQDDGIYCEWDAYSRECEDAVAYGCICALCYTELNARPTEEEQEKCNGFCGEYECKENPTICKRKAQEK